MEPAKILEAHCNAREKLIDRWSGCSVKDTFLELNRVSILTVKVLPVRYDVLVRTHLLSRVFSKMC